MSAYTKGPWRIEHWPYPHVRSDSGCVFASDYVPDANARLIASAPCMASELLSALDYFESREDIASEHNDDGSPRPNLEMNHANSIREVLKRAGIDPENGGAL